VHRHTPLLCPADESLLMFRKWVKQFYLDPKTADRVGAAAT